MTFLFIQPLGPFFTFILTNQQGNQKKFLKVHWSDFHLRSLDGVVISFPSFPVDTIAVR